MLQETDIQKTLSNFKPECAVFVLSVDENEKASGMIAAWKTRVSSNPARYAVSLSKKGQTHKLIQKSKEFVVAVPNKALEKALLFFGSKHGNEVDKFKETNLETIPSKHLKTPLIKEATICYECKLVNEVDAGDHFLFIGEVVAAHHNKDKKVMLCMGKDEKGDRIFEEF